MKNSDLAASFREIKSLLKQTGEKNDFRLKAYDRAANQLDLLDTELQSLFDVGAESVNSYLEPVKAIGDKSIKKILQLLETGTCDELEALRPVVLAQYQQDTMDLTEPKADEPVRRPWAEADQVAAQVVPVILAQFNTTATVCGSYRRHKPMVKDIDIVVTFDGKDAEPNFNQVLVALGVDLTSVIKKGPSQCSFMVSGFQVDLWTVPSESKGAAVLFATGSADFNIQMRGWLKAKGMKLNRYMLATADGKRLAGSTEEEIFKALGLKFVKPEDRTNFNPEFEV